jgi:hypothetical protein
MTMRWTRTVATLIALFPATTGALALSDQERRDAALCQAAARKAEGIEKLPRGLLEAISLKESGRWDGEMKHSVAWPWTVTSGGEGEHFASKAKALAKVRALRGQGVENIDVGCLQINLRYHPHAFENIEDAFDPAKNAGYAGAHLRQLREDHNSWSRAVERYHTSNPKRGAAYREKVYKLKFAATKAKRVAAHATATSTWRERQQAKRKAYEAAKKARRKLVKDLRKTKTKHEKELRAAFEERRARVFQRWEEMMKKRREAAGGKRS